MLYCYISGYNIYKRIVTSQRELVPRLPSEARLAIFAKYSSLAMLATAFSICG